MKQKVHPNSLANLTREGRPLTYEEPKKPRSVSVTPTGWVGVQTTARSLGLSISELLERLGRGDLVISPAVERDPVNRVA